MSETEALDCVELAPYDPAWARLYDAARAELTELGGSDLLRLEHIGSTAVPGLAAKPIIDMMGSVPELETGRRLASQLELSGWALIETGMRDRLLLRRRDGPALAFHLHIVEESTWPDRHEWLMRDFLLARPEAAVAYGRLKMRLATTYRKDSLAYTRAKTDFIQDLIDQARDAAGLPRISVWTE